MEFWDKLGSKFGTLFLIVTTFDRIIPFEVRNMIQRYLDYLINFFNPRIHITFDEFPPESYGRSKAYDAIQTYLGAKFCDQAERLRGNLARDKRSVSLSVDDYEVITDTYNGVKVSWMRSKRTPNAKIITKNDKRIEKRYYVVTFGRKNRDMIVGSYLSHVLSEGKAIQKRSRGQRLYTNVTDGWGDGDMEWSFVGFDHPATFETLAMDPKKKKDVMDDLIEYTKGKEYYRRIGKPWKRGYLLYGPPGTGKSSMIAAIANFLEYDIYDLELTAVKDNTALRKLMMDIGKRAVVVIEDIDCSLPITGKRKHNDESMPKRGNKGKKDSDSSDEDEEDEDKKKSKVTLSGLLNFMDGLWSASGGERIFVLTTNHVEKLDEALVRRGRMDKHIEMSYCCFEAFKVLANNYLGLQLECHHKYFETIRCLLSEADISPADVAENLMPKSVEMSADQRLENLIGVLKLKSKQKGDKSIVKKVKTGNTGKELPCPKVRRRVCLNK